VWRAAHRLVVAGGSAWNGNRSRTIINGLFAHDTLGSAVRQNG